MDRSLDIKVMTEGRMKGQAFVIFPTQELAERALHDVNGYSLQGKPLIIVCTGPQHKLFIFWDRQNGHPVSSKLNLHEENS